MIVGDMEIRLRAEIARLQQDMDRARQTVDRAMNRIGASVGTAMQTVAGLAAGLSVGLFVNFVKDAIDAADALNDLSARSKVGIEDLAGLAYGAKLSDTSLEGVASSINKLSQNIGKDGAKFRELGITATEPLEAFKQLADVFQGIQDPQQRAAFGAEALGKSWQDAAVLLDGGSAGIATMIAQGKELSGITEQVAADAGAFNDKLDEMGFAVQGVGTRIAAGLLPTLNQIVGSMSSSAVKGDELRGVVNILSGTLKVLYTVGVGVVEVFATMGKAIGAAAAMTVATLSGDFRGAFEIYQQLGSDIGDGWVDSARRVSIAWSTASTGVTQGAVETGKAVADSAALVAGFLNSSDIEAARKKAADSAKKIQEESLKWYASVRDASIDQLMQLEAERNGQVALSAEEKKRIEIMNDLLKHGKNLTEQQRNDIQGWADATVVLSKYNHELAESKKAREQREGESYSDVAAAREQGRALQDQIKYYGLAEDAVLKLQAAEMQRGLDGGFIDDIERGRLQGLLDATNEQIALQGQLSAMKSESTFWSGLDDTAHQTFLSIANGSKDVATRLKETFKNIFFDWLYQMTVRKWLINIGTTVSGTAGVSGIANAAGIPGMGGGTGNSTFDLLSMGKTIYQGFTTGFAGVGASLGGYVAALGNTFGSASISAFGAGMGMTSSQAATAAAAYNSAGMASTGSALTAGSTAGAAAGVFAGVAGGVYGGRMISGGYSAFGGSGNSAVNTGTAVGAAVGSIIPVIGTALGALIGGLLGGAANRLFGHKAPKVDSQGIRGSIGMDGITAETYANIVSKGGTFRSDKWNYEKAALDAQTDSGLDATLKTMLTSVKGFGKALGIEASAIDGYTKVFDIKLTGDAAKDNDLVLGLLDSVGNELALRLVPSLAKFAVEGEAMTVTLQRLTTNYVAVDTMLGAIGKTVGVVGVAGIEARERLIAAAGGLESLASGVSFFQANFLTEAERIAPLQKQVAEALRDMGRSSIKTSEDFKAAALGIDVSTQEGANLFAQMMALAPAFKSVADYAAELSDAVVLTAAQVREQSKDLQQQLMEITKSEAGRLAMQRAGIADVNKALFDQVQAAKAVVSAKDALATAYEREASAAKDALDRSKDWVTTLNGLNANLALGSQSILTPEQQYAEARKQFEKTLAAANAGDSTAQSGLSAAEQAFLAASQKVNASDARYAADYARVIAANEEASKWASTQVDLQQASYNALEAQVKGLITINDSVLTVAQAIANLRTVTGTASGLGVRFDGSHASGLTNVPFDGYAAELHQGEVVVDAQAAAAMRRYFGGSPSQGGGNNDALVAEIKALRTEVAEARTERKQHTQAIIQGGFAATDKAAEKISSGARAAATGSAWQKQSRKEASTT